MSVIDSLIDMFAHMDHENIEVHEERCVCVRNRNANCLKCVEVCTTGAISYEANDLQVHPEKCIGCGACANACPTCALEVKGLSDSDLTRAVKQSIRVTQGHPVVICQTALAAAQERLAGDVPKKRGLFRKEEPTARIDENAVCAVPCLGRIDESMLVGVAAYGSFDVSLVCHDCENCEHHAGGVFVREVAKGARNLLDAFGSEMPITITDQVPRRVVIVPGVNGAAAPDRGDGGVSRRAVLGEAKNAGMKLAAEGIDDALGVEKPAPVPVAYRKVDPETGTLSHFVPTRRTRMYNYLRHIGEPVADEVETRVVGRLVIDSSKCSSCRMCAVFCPTGAIMKVDEPETFGVFHRPAACVQCRLCESLCPEQAITIESTIPIKQFMGQKGLLYEMKRPEWKPNKPDSLFAKIHSVIGSDLEMSSY